jgi:hypothetical protein
MTRDGWVRSIPQPMSTAPRVAPIWNIAVTLDAAVIERPASFISVGSQPVSK